MAVKISPKYLDKFESSDPDLFHKIYFEFTRPYLEGKRILNIGCWTGSYEAMFRNMPGQMIGIDLSAQALEIARQSNAGCDFLAADLFKLPFKEESFDVASMFTVLEHLPKNSEERAIGAVNRILKPDGLLIITTPNNNIMGNVFDIAYWMVGHRHYKIKQVERILDNCGFKLEKLLVRGRFWNNFSIPFFYLFKYLFNMNIYRNRFVEKVLRNEYKKEGYRDIFLIARKK